MYFKVYMILEQIGIVLGLFLLYYVTDVIAVSFMISLILYLWYVSLTVDLVDVYLMTKNIVRNSSWFPCFSDSVKEEGEGSSKEEIQDVGTNRPFNSKVDN